VKSPNDAHAEKNGQLARTHGAARLTRQAQKWKPVLRRISGWNNGLILSGCAGFRKTGDSTFSPGALLRGARAAP
jgi:hypothetical protein